MTERPLTERQQQVLDYIACHIHDRGIPPTVREIGKHFGITSPNGVAGHLQRLERKGCIELLPDTSRGIRLLNVMAENALDDRQRELVAAARHLLEDDVDDYIFHFKRLEAAVKAYAKE